MTINAKKCFKIIIKSSVNQTLIERNDYFPIFSVFSVYCLHCVFILLFVFVLSLCLFLCRFRLVIPQILLRTDVSKIFSFHLSSLFKVHAAALYITMVLGIIILLLFNTECMCYSGLMFVLWTVRFPTAAVTGLGNYC